MRQQLLAYTWHPFKGNYRPLASTFYNDGVSVRAWSQTNLASLFCSHTSQPHRTRWCALAVIELSLSAESKILHVRELHVGRIENSASSPRINHLTSLTVSFSCLRAYYPHLAILHANPVAFLRNLWVQNTYRAATWSPVLFFAKHCILTTVSRLDGVLGKLGFGGGFF